MNDVQHMSDLRHFRAKAKSWGEPAFRAGLIQKLNNQAHDESVDKSIEYLQNSPCRFTDFCVKS